jgi:hypothetical protein
MVDTACLAEDADIRRIWGADLQAIGCLNCGVAHLVPASEQLGVCPNCWSGDLEPQPARLRPEPPELAVPFAGDLGRDALSLRLAEWLRGVWLRPQDLQTAHLVSRLQRVFVPRWLVDGTVVATWGARMGFDYQVESSQEHFVENQGWTTRQLRETRVRWEARVGVIQRTYHNLAVPALERVEEDTFKARAGAYQLDQAVPYAGETIAGAVVRVPSLLPREAWPLGRTALDAHAADDCQRAAKAQHSEEFELEADYRDLNWTQLLLPVFVTYYTDDAGSVVPVWINGQSGRVGGVRRASMRKAWRVAVVLAIVAVLTFLASGVAVLLNAEVIAAPVMALGFLTALSAAAPVIWVWQFNQGEARIQPQR